ncbi:MAG: type transporter [Frankiales bacterium]|nr:type transporter [Frankiales bacterium]
MPQLSAIWTFRGLIGNFAQRELRGKYKGSALGQLWSLLNPLATLAIYSLVFGIFLRQTPEVAGNGHLRNFAVYLFTALVAWNFFNAVVTGAISALVGAGPLLKKIYFPPFAPVIGGAAATLYQAGIEIGLLVFVMLLARNVSFTFLLLPVLLAMLALFALGLGLVLARLNVKYRDVSYIVSIGMNLLFYGTPIIYKLDIVPEHHDGVPLRRILQFNPLTQFVEAFRDCVYRLQVPSAARLLALLVISVVVFLLGFTYFERGARDVAEEL